MFPDEVLARALVLDVTVRYNQCVGDHVVTGSPIAHVWGAAAVDPTVAAEIADAGLRVGFERTFEQDTAFGLRQLADISLRAMSPAINDPYTAEQCVYHMTVVLCASLSGDLGPQTWRDRDGVARVLIPKADLGAFLDLACGQLRRVAAHEPRVVVAMLRLLAEVGGRCPPTERGGRRAAGGGAPPRRRPAVDQTGRRRRHGRDRLRRHRRWRGAA